jgi:hypothetical protein
MNIERISDQYRPRLRHYFLVQLGDADEAHACAEETVRLFFAGAEGRRRRAEVHLNVHLMRIAFGLCARKQAEKWSQSAAA